MSYFSFKNTIIHIKKQPFPLFGEPLFYHGKRFFPWKKKYLQTSKICLIFAAENVINQIFRRMKKDPKVVDVQGLTTKKRRNQVTIQIEPKGCHIQARIDSQRLISTSDESLVLPETTIPTLIISI